MSGKLKKTISAELYAQILENVARNAQDLCSVINIQKGLNLMQLKYSSPIIHNCYLQSYIECIRVTADIDLVHSWVAKI